MKPLQYGPIQLTDGRIQWNLWAPRARRADLHFFVHDSGESFSTKTVHLSPMKHGFFAGITQTVETGQRYGYSINGGPVRPDPASRWQPDGVHQPSAYWDPSEYVWRDSTWKGTRAAELILYELHIGTFSQTGTFNAIIERLGYLVDLGVNAIELMPVAQFPGEFGWGYDGVYWYSVHNSYGGPQALQALVDECHAHGLSVILDVVYNHFGPEGNYFGEFAPIYSGSHRTPWGEAINFDESNSLAMRDFVIENALFWIRQFHIDGFRLDAVHAMKDTSPEHILRSFKKTCQAEATRLQRPIHVIAESNMNDVIILDDPTHNGYGIDKQWNDDFHHCVHALLTQERDGYYVDFSTPELQLEKVFHHVFVHDGIHSKFLNREHGKPVGEHPGERFVASIQTHDQVGNRATGDRFGTLISIEQQRLAAALLILSPFTPMLFMGEEYSEVNGFPFFCDFHDAVLKAAVQQGRQNEFSEFRWLQAMCDPTIRKTFESAKLTSQALFSSEQKAHLNLYRWLIQFRKQKGNLTDRALLCAKLHTFGVGNHILELSRYLDVAHQEWDWAAIFNLSASELDIQHSPLFDRVKTANLSRFEMFQCGTGDLDKSGLEVLAPFDFLILESRRECNCSASLDPSQSVPRHSDNGMSGGRA